MRFVLLLLGLALLAGCASLETASLRQPASLPPRAEVADVPFFPQEAKHCGPAALATVVTWAGEPATPEGLTPLVYTPEREGTLPQDLVLGARRSGRMAVPVRSLAGLLAEIAAGNPVLVLQNLGLSWYPQWHYAVAVGYDLEQGEIALRSGRERRRVISLATFERTWARGGRWALVVLPPERLPARADREALVHAAAGLERAGKPAAAEAAYSSILKRWPDEVQARIGLANARYAQDDLAGAAAALRAAVASHPETAVAWNNLAHVLARQGRHDEARFAAERAVRLGGAHLATSRRTLHEIAALEGAR